MSTLITGSQLKALSRFVADQGVRYYLCGVLFDAKGFAVSTNGHALLVTKILPFDGEDFIVPTATIKAALSLKKGKSTQFDVSNTSFDGMAYTPIDGKFPDWRRVMPGKLSGRAAQFDGRYLEAARKALVDLGSKDVAVTMATNGRGPALVDSDSPDALIVIMPVRTSEVAPAAMTAHAEAFLKVDVPAKSIAA